MRYETRLCWHSMPSDPSMADTDAQPPPLALRAPSTSVQPSIGHGPTHVPNHSG